MKTQEIICRTCLHSFSAQIREINRGNGIYCSAKCSSNRPRTPKQPNHKCSRCTKLFYRPKSKSDERQTKHGFLFCSRKCKDNSQRIGGIKEIQPKHYGTSTADYRALAFANLLNQCARCGFDKHLKVLEVHHKDRNRSNNQLENLEILCPTCHTIEHFNLE